MTEEISRCKTKDGELFIQRIANWSPLHEACFLGAEDTVAKLLAANSRKQIAAIEMANRQTMTGRTALHVASSEGNHSIVDMLLKAGASVHMRNLTGQTALHHACCSSDSSIVTKLIGAGADVNALDAYHETPLFLAAKRGSHSIVSILLEAGADVNFTNHRGQTVLSVCNECPSDDQLARTKRLLLAHGSI